MIDERPTDATPKPDHWDHPGEFIKKTVVRDDGTTVDLTIPERGKLLAWVKPAGEPSEVLAESPSVFHARWMWFKQHPEQAAVWFHAQQSGQAFAYYREAIPHMWKFGITYWSTPPDHTANSFHTGQCPCPQCSADRD